MYIKGPDNDAVDALIRISFINSVVSEIKITCKTLAKIYCVDKLYGDLFSLPYQMI